MRRLRKESLATPLFFVSSVVMIVVAAFISHLMLSTSAFLRSNIESRLIALSLLAAKAVTPEELAAMAEPGDLESPLGKELKGRLVGFAEETGVLYVYYLRQTAKGECQFVMDNDLTEDSVGLFSDPIPCEESPLLAFGGTAATAGLGNYSVGYTGLLSSFAPVRGADGTVVAIAGVDITDEPVILMQTWVRRMAALLVASVAVALASGLLGLSLYRRKARQSETANQSKSRFLANMSHEIRNPLNAIIGLSDIELQQSLPAETLSNIVKIRRSGSTLLAIINDILDISKIEAGSFTIADQEFEAPALISEVVQLNIVRIGSKPLKFELKVDAGFPRTLRGDELRIRQIVSNILSNSIKYTKEGKVSMEVSLGQRDPSRRDAPGLADCVFKVSDTGIGIRAEDIPKLFRDYTQVDPKANRNIEGTGLGLSITKMLLDLMGGRVEVESVHGEGSTFTVTIPLPAVGEATVGEKVKAELEGFTYGIGKGLAGAKFVRSRIPPGRVLVVDDLEVNLLVAKGLLRNYGLSVDTALSGREAVDKIRACMEGGPEGRYDIVFMDHIMPGMDGVEATRLIRGELGSEGGPGSEYARTLPIVALTANALAGAREMFLENGFNSFLSKPISIPGLDAELARWVKAKEPQAGPGLPRANC
jgi:signal transduction histidine kinase/CheY-like chemotaxis protein